MDFAPNWEKHLLKFWADANNEYAVLSTYVADYHQLGVCVNDQFEVPHLCQVKFAIFVCFLLFMWPHTYICFNFSILFNIFQHFSI